MKSEIKQRNIFAVIIFSIITLGIYSLYLYFAFGSELRRESIRQNTQNNLVGPFIALLLSIITLGIYGLYYIYKQAATIKEIGQKYNYPALAPIIVLILTFFFGIGALLNVYGGTQVAKNMAGQA